MNLLQVSLLFGSVVFVESQFTFPDFGSIKHCRNQKNCIEVEACPGALEHLKIGIKPGLICGFNGKIAKICCGENHFGEVSKQKCKEFHKNVKPIQNHEFEVQKYPHMVALGYGYPGRINWACAGTLISEKFILTSAKCLNHHIHGEVKVVRLGDIDLSSDSDDTNAINYKINKIIPHPYFKLPNLYHDLGLIELQKVVQFNDGVRPACLQTEDKSIGDLVLTGWHKEGSLIKIAMSDYTEFAVEHLDLFYRNVDIKDKYPKFSNETHIVADMFFNRGPCQLVDDGSPLGPFNPNAENGLTVSAVTSLPLSCEGPGIYTKVIGYLPWIETYVWN